MMALWERRSLSVKDLGEMLYLDSGTLTPLLKKLEEKGYVLRSRCQEDERVLDVSLTPEGEALKEKAKSVPESMMSCLSISPEDAAELARILRSLMGTLRGGR